VVGPRKKAEVKKEKKQNPAKKAKKLAKQDEKEE
jgi:hypothetical protein